MITWSVTNLWAWIGTIRLLNMFANRSARLPSGSNVLHFLFCHPNVVSLHFPQRCWGIVLPRIQRCWVSGQPFCPAMSSQHGLEHFLLYRFIIVAFRTNLRRCRRFQATQSFNLHPCTPLSQRFHGEERLHISCTPCHIAYRFANTRELHLHVTLIAS